jgi:hypothetical protein
MKLHRWSMVIPVMGLLLALSPLSALAGPNQFFGHQPNYGACTPHQPHGNAFGWHNQRPQWHHSFAQRHHPGYEHFRHPNLGHHYGPRAPFAHAGYPGHNPGPYFGPQAYGY